jgi:hypothetical protein
MHEKIYKRKTASTQLTDEFCDAFTDSGLAARQPNFINSTPHEQRRKSNDFLVCEYVILRG